MQPSTCAFELTMPTDGSNWVEVEGDVGPVDATDPSDYRANADSLSQNFTYGAGPSVLTLDLQFQTAEGTGSTTFNDFCAVEVEEVSSGTFSTLAVIDTATGNFAGTSTCTAS